MQAVDAQIEYLSSAVGSAGAQQLYDQAIECTEQLEQARAVREWAVGQLTALEDEKNRVVTKARQLEHEQKQAADGARCVS